MFNKSLLLLVLGVSLSALAIDLTAMKIFHASLHFTDLLLVCALLGALFAGVVCAGACVHQSALPVWERLPARLRAWAGVLTVLSIAILCFLIWKPIEGVSAYTFYHPDGPLAPMVAVACLVGVLVGAHQSMKQPWFEAALKVAALASAAAFTLCVVCQLHFMSHLPSAMLAVTATVIAMFGWWITCLTWVLGASCRASVAQRVALGAMSALVICALFGARFVDNSRVNIALYDRSVLASNLLRELHRVVPPKTPRSFDCAGVRLPESPETSTSRGRPFQGVVVIMVDTLRLDRLGATLKGEPVTPELERFAKQSTRFTTAYTMNPFTRGSLRLLSEGQFQQGGGHEKLVDRLNRQQVRTYAMPIHKHASFEFGGAQVLDKSLMVDQQGDEITSPQVYEKSIKMLEQVEPSEKFFHFIHYFDPHLHYVRNSQFDFGGSAWERYNAEVKLADHWIGRYLEKLAAHPLGKDTLVVLFSDHGDEFLEHGFYYHSLKLYDESTRLLMLVHDPRDPTGRTIEAPASIVDVGETVADALGLESTGTQGRSLLQPKRLSQDRVLPLKGKWSDGAVSKTHKLIRQNKWGYVELYDLLRDPGEHHSVADEQPELVRALSCQADALLGR